MNCTVVAIAVYVVVTALLFRDLLPDVATHLYSDLGDPLLNASVLAWSAQHLPLSEAWWNFPSFAPLSGVTAFTEHLLVTYPVSAPIIWLTGNVILAHNAVFVLAFPLNGLAAYFLAREVTGSSSAALVGGLAFAFAPYVSVHLSHLQTLMAFGMPLGLLGLHRYLAAGDRGSGIGDRGNVRDSHDRLDPGAVATDPRSPIPDPRRALLLFGLGWLITSFSNAYVLVFFPLLVAFWCAWFVRPREWRRLVAPMLTAMAFTLPVVPLLCGYHVRQSAYGFVREMNEVVMFSADMVGLAGVSHREWLWRGILPHTYEERALFPGLTIAALAIVAVWASRPPASAAPVRPRAIRRESRRSPSTALFLFAGVLMLVTLARVWTGPFGWHLGPIALPPITPYRVVTVAAIAFVLGVLSTRRVRDAWSRRDTVAFYAAATIVLWLLALGPQPEWTQWWRAIAYGPYWLLFELPGGSSIRVPARAWLPAVLCLAVLAAAGVAALERRLATAGRRPRTHRALLTALAIAIVAEGWFFDRHVPVPAPMPQGVIPVGAMVLDLPIDQGFWNAIPQYRAVRGLYRTVNGYSGYEPPHFLPMRRAIADLEVEALNPYRMLADLYVIVRPDTPEDVARWVAEHPGAERVHASPEAQVFKLPRLHPDAPRRPLPLPLPARRQRPFGLPN